jgi:hypothetical protein
MLLILHPRRLSAPVPVANSDAATWTEADPGLGMAEGESFGWFDLGFPHKRPKRNTLLSTWTSGIPPSPGDEMGLEGR